MRHIVLIFLAAQCNLLCNYSEQQKSRINEHQTNVGIIQLKSTFYNTNGTIAFSDLKKVWYRDSLSIEQVNKTNFETSAGATTVTSSVLIYRLIDLDSRTLYDYKSFSDTALIVHKSVLPDSMMLDYGWSYYSKEVRQIQGVPQALNDTVIDNISYKRFRFNFSRDDLHKSYKIGYYRCDKKGRQFSLEKQFSEKLNCTMMKFVEFRVDNSNPTASLEIEFLSDSLTADEHKVFDAWEKNIKKYPVKGGH